MSNWYVMRSKPNKEELLHEQLSIRGIESYCPHIKVRPVNPRASKTKPYFPSYVFIRANPETVGASTLEWLPGAIGLVRFGDEFANVEDVLVQAIRRKVDQLNAAKGELFKGLKTGDVVTIQTGPFAGYHAIFDSRLSGHERARVLLNLLQDRQIRLEVALVDIERFEQARPA